MVGIEQALPYIERLLKQHACFGILCLPEPQHAKIVEHGGGIGRVKCRFPAQRGNGALKIGSGFVVAALIAQQAAYFALLERLMQQVCSRYLSYNSMRHDRHSMLLSV